MADNVEAASGSGGPYFKTDQLSEAGSEIHWPYAKLAWGPDGTANITDTNLPIPIQLRNSSGSEADINASRQLAVSVDNTPTVTVGTFPDNEPFNLNQIGGTAIVAGNGIAGAGAQRVCIASDNTAFNVNVASVSDGGNSMTVDVGTELPAGTQNIGDVDIASIAAGANRIGKVTIRNSTDSADIDPLADGGNVVVTAFPDNEPFDLAQVGGTSVVTGNGIAGAGAQRVCIASDNTAFNVNVASVSDGGNSLTIDGTVNIGTFPDNEPFDLNQIGGTAILAGNGVAGAGAQRVCIASDNTAFSVNATLQASTNTQEVVGDAAHGASVSGNPVLIGTEARTTDGTVVTSGQVVRPIADNLGKQVVLVGAINDNQLSGYTNYTTTTAADIIAAQGANIRIAVMSVLVTNAHATVDTKVEVRDGTTVKIRGFAVADGGGFSMNGGGTPLFIATANTAVTGRCVTTGADVDIFVSGYEYKPV